MLVVYLQRTGIWWEIKCEKEVSAHKVVSAHKGVSAHKLETLNPKP